MSKSYVIYWKSKINGRSGKGTKLFEWEEAQELANELNQEYPEIQHEPKEIGPSSAPAAHEPEAAQPPQAGHQAEAGAENEQVTHDPAPALSLP